MRETMKNIIYSLLITTMIASCGDAPEEYSDTNTSEKISSTNNLQYIDITNAKSLYISNSTGRTSSRGNIKNKLFKITEDGMVEEVEYMNADNSTYTVTNQPLAVDVVDTDYIVFSFGDYVNDPTSCYLVKKSTGEVHILGRVIDPIVHADCPLSQTSSREKKILTDSKGNLYYRYYGYSGNEDNETYYRLRKVNYTNPKNIVATQITNHNESIENFVVDSEGNVAYNIIGRNSKVFWIGFDGKIKYDNTDAKLTSGYYKLYQDDKLILFDPMSNGKYIIDNGKELVTKELTTSLLIQFLLDIKCQHTFECSTEK